MARTRKRRFLRGVVLGWLAAYFFDPRLGRGRRALTRDWLLSRGRRLVRSGERTQRHLTAAAYGKKQAFLHRHEAPKPQPDDVTLAHKVESELYRRAGVPKRHVSINAEDGVVFLRGVMDRQEDIERMEAEARRIAGVRDVENLVHLPGTPAPASRPKLERERAAGSRRHARHGS